MRTWHMAETNHTAPRILLTCIHCLKTRDTKVSSVRKYRTLDPVTHRYVCLSCLRASGNMY